MSTSGGGVDLLLPFQGRRGLEVVWPWRLATIDSVFAWRLVGMSAVDDI